jgi:glutathione synthase/RimK-type ligase-like ATP-grasp enzyme
MKTLCVSSVAQLESQVILIVSHPADDHAVGVLDALDRLGHPAVLVDTARFPSDASLIQRFESDQQSYEWSIDGRSIDLTACRAGWWRRPQPFTLQSGISPDVISFTYSECHEAVAGLWAALNLNWMNPPERDELAHHKPYQLAVATKVGLPVPRTIITNDPDVARKFIAALGPERTVYKTFLASEQCWRETRVVRSDELKLLDSVRLAPVIFQEYVPAIADVRVTVVGERMFAAAITPTPGGYELDYRMDMDGASFEPIELPVETQQGVHALMERLGLVFGAVDLRRTPDERYIFLEINPAGEWCFVEERTDQPITYTVAELLAELDQ